LYRTKCIIFGQLRKQGEFYFAKTEACEAASLLCFVFFELLRALRAVESGRPKLTTRLPRLVGALVGAAGIRRVRDVRTLGTIPHDRAGQNVPIRPYESGAR